MNVNIITLIYATSTREKLEEIILAVLSTERKRFQMRINMENNPVTGFLAITVPTEIRERYSNWSVEAWLPLLMKNPHLKGIDRYQAVHESDSYPYALVNTHYENRREWEQSSLDQLRQAVFADVETWRKRGSETIWRAVYYLILSYRNGAVISGENARDIDVENNPVMHLEGLYLSGEEVPRYEEWFTRWGCEIYLPLIGKLPGMKRYDFCKLFCDYADANTTMKAKYPNAHPVYLSVLHFTDIKSFENYERSPELAAFRQGLRASFPKGLEYKWFVQYQLQHSWRK